MENGGTIRLKLMPMISVNGVELCYELSVTGSPMVLVHGSSIDQTTWFLVVPELEGDFRVATYDRRGHGRSGSVPGAGSIDDDVDDLSALLHGLHLAPAHVVGSSFGSLVARRLAAREPKAIRSLAVHEPPVLFYRAEDLEQLPVLEELVRIGGEIFEQVERGDLPGGARRFVDELAMGSGGWKSLTDAQREVFIANIRTWLDERTEPAAYDIDRRALARFDGPVLISEGGRSPKHLKRIAQKIRSETFPNAKYVLVESWGHIPHLTHPAEYAAMVREFASAATA